MRPGYIFQLDLRDERLNRIGNKLELMAKLIPWESFRPRLEWMYKNSPKGGRPPYDPVMMLKILVLQGLYNISDEEMEYQIVDRISFQKFLGIEPDDRIPDARTIWVFRERVKNEGVYNFFFREFNEYLAKNGYKAMGGQMVDATFQQVPTQHNTPDENREIKETGEAPKTWTAKKKAHKDVDARWTKKRNRSYFGYKNHVNVDRAHKFIRDFRVTPANVHDSQRFEEMLDSKASDRGVWADSAYVSEEHLAKLREMGLEPHLCEKGYREHPLTDEQKQSNREKSRVRSRVEHVFGQISQTCRGRRTLFTIGLLRAEVKICFQNLAYNMFRLAILSHSKPKPRPSMGKLRTC